MANEEVVVRRNPDVAHEVSDVSPRVVAGTVIGTLAGTLLVVGMLWFLFQFLRSRYESIADVFGSPDRFQSMTAQPVLQHSPTHDLEVFKAEQQRKLHSYGWIDRQRGIVSIPIDRAMEIVAQKGLPAAESMPNLQVGIPSAGHRQTGFDRTVALPEESQ